MAKHPDWEWIGQAPGAPVLVDFPVVARRRREYETRTRLALELWSPEGDRYGLAYVYPDEGYPGCPRLVPFSHYEPLLRRALEGLRALGRPEEVRLQVLKAVCASPEGRSVTLLKFIIGPEHAIEGSQIETVYSCPLRAFFENFLCLPTDCLERSESIDFVVGRAVHQGYRWAAQAQAAGADSQEVAAGYRRGVVASFLQDFAVFLNKVPRGSSPLKAHTVPVEAQGCVARRCQEKFGALPARARLYHERLFYAPQRGISGKADRLLVTPPTDGESPDEEADGRLELYELKTHATGFGERDPRTGRQAPGGIQALTYHEALRALTTHPSLLTHVELYEAGADAAEGGTFAEIPLAAHPVLTRAEVPLDGSDDRYLDLIAQNRNLGYLAESGLLTGYDRALLADLIQSGRRLRGLGGLFDLTGSIPPCSFCPGQTRGLCEDAAHYYRTPPMPAFFRRVPDALFRYWAWFHRQVRHELNATKQHLHRLGEAAPEELEREGITVAGLTLVARDERTVRLARESRIETRLREGDTVLVSDDQSRPADGFSAEGRITRLEPEAVELELTDPELPEATRYRIDQFAHVAQTRWQAQGLTDLLAASMAAAGVQGRSVQTDDLPWLARVLLGEARPELPEPVPLPHLEGTLNAGQLEAAGRALALPEEGLLLLQGPPGTGKTQWVAHLVHEIVKRRFFDDGPTRPVLVLANTHRAADEVVRKLDTTFPELRPYLIRIGQPGRDSDEAVARHTLVRMLNVPEALARLDFANPAMDEFMRVLKKGELTLQHAAVFVGTLGSVTAPEIRGLSFAYTLVDEAGQATEPATLQALRHLPSGYRGRLLLVGDHKQLPPVVPEDLAAEPVPDVLRRAGLREGETMRISLFERLARLYPGVLLSLTEQYRMNGPICRLVSDTFYEGRLRPGSTAVARATLEALHTRLGARPRGLTGLAQRVFDPAVPVVFIDTSDDPTAAESAADLGSYESRDNPREAALVASLLAAYLRAWPQSRWPEVSEEIGVISAYRRQNNRIRQEVAERLGVEAAAAIRVDTVDRFQGGEKPILFVSLVSHGSLGRLHHEWRRMNVSLSRAMHKLVLIGSRETFRAPGGEGLEAEARAYYQQLFQTLDELAAAGAATILDSRGMGPEVS